MGLLPRDIICGTTHHGFCSCKSPEGSSRIEKVPSPAIVAAGFTRTIIYTVISSNHLAIRASEEELDRLLAPTWARRSEFYSCGGCSLRGLGFDPSRYFYVVRPGTLLR